MRVRLLALLLQGLGGPGFLLIAAGMLLLPSATYMLFPWVLGFNVHLSVYLTNAILLFVAAYLISKRQRSGIVISIPNLLLVVIFGILESLRGALYGVGDIVFGVLLLAIVLTQRLENPRGFWKR